MAQKIRGGYQAPEGVSKPPLPTTGSGVQPPTHSSFADSDHADLKTRVKKFEYRLAVMSPANSVVALQRIGDEGWELVSVVMTEPMMAMFFFKRQAG